MWVELAVFLLYKLRLPLIRQALLVEYFGIVWLHFYCAVVVVVRQLKLRLRLPVEVHVSAIEVDVGVIRILLNRLIKVILRILNVIILVAGEAAVVEVRGGGINQYRLIIILNRLLIVLLLKVRQAKIVVGRRFLHRHLIRLLNRLFQLSNRLFDIAVSAMANAFIEPRLIHILPLVTLKMAE